MIDGRIFLYQPINSMIKTYENIRKIYTGYGDDYSTGCLLDYSYLKKDATMFFIIEKVKETSTFISVKWHNTTV